MVAALTLLLAAQGSASPPATDPLEAVLDRSNRLLISLPGYMESATSRRSDTVVAMRVARKGYAEHMQFRRADLLRVESFNDGKRCVWLSFDDNTYYQIPSTTPQKPSYEEAMKAPLSPLEENEFDLAMNGERGLVLRSNPPLRILQEEPATTTGGENPQDLGAGRKFMGRLTKPSKDGVPDGSKLEWRVFVDASGLIRRAEVDSIKDGETGRVLYVCDPGVPADEPFTFDVARLKDWIKSDPPGTQ